MSSDNEKKAAPQHFAPPQLPPGAYPFPQGMQGNVQFQPVYYQPVPYDVATSVNGEEQAFIGQEGEKKCFFSRICKRWRNRRCARKCGKVVDDGRALGNLNNFIAGVLFGTVAPFFSLLCVFGFETKKLTRTGTLFGHANFFLLLAACLLAFGTGPHAPPQGGHHSHGVEPFVPLNNNTIPYDVNNTTEVSAPYGLPLPDPTPQSGALPEKTDDKENDDSEDDDSKSGDSKKDDEDDDKKDDEDDDKKDDEKKDHKEKGEKNKKDKNGKHKDGKKKKGCKMFKVAVGVSFGVGIIFLIASFKSFRRFMSIYRTRENKTESDVVQVVSEAGNCRGFFLGVIASLLWPMVGTALILIIRRKNLTSRYGALHGLGIVFVIVGIVGAFHGIPPFALLKGLLLCQISSVHFKRAIATANAKEEKTVNC